MGDSSTRYRWWLAWSAVSLALVGVLGCRTFTEADSAVLHIESEPTRGNIPWLWQEVSAAELRETVLPNEGVTDLSALVPDSSPLVARMNFWIDAMDAALRAKIRARRGEDYYQRTLGKVPKPRAAIIVDPVANAYVPSVLLCLDLPVSFPRRAGVREESLPYVALTTYGPVTEQYAEPLCVRKQATTPELAELFEWYSGQHATCRINLGSGPMVTLSDGCELGSDVERYGGARALTWATTADWVLVNTGFFLQFTKETDMLAILAHELGHYYRSHMTVFEGEYYYFYRLTDTPVAAKPTPDPDLRAEGAIARQSSRILQNVAVRSPKIPAAVFHEVTYLFKRACDLLRQECSPACLDANSYLKAEGDAFYAYPDEDLSEVGKVAYRVYEAKALACAATIPVQTQYANNVVTFQRLRQALARSHADLVLGADISSARTLAEVIAIWTASVPRAKEIARSAVQRYARNGLGYYTPEQEADELGLEIAVALGYRPEDVVSGAFVFYAGTRNPDPEEPDTLHGGWSMARCKEAMTRGWTEDGRAVIPPVADFHGDHHSNCFRVFNLARDAGVHGYGGRPDRVVPPASPTWSELRALARAAQ